MLGVAGFAPLLAWGAGAAKSPAEADDEPVKDAHHMVMGDFNRDGIMDRAETSLPDGGRSEGVLTISLGRADGTFQETPTKVALGHKPQSIVAGDFNGDGSLDVIVGDAGGAVVLFVGDGTGSVTFAKQIGHFDSVVSMAAADFNRDGVTDLAVSDAHASTVTVMLGNGSGAFQREGSFPMRMMGTAPHVAVADFNGDGIPDLAVVYDNEDGDTFDVLLGNGKGNFTAAPELGRVRDPNAHCVT